MRVVLSTYGSRGDVEPMAGLAMGLRALGVDVGVCAPPEEEFTELLARAGLPLVPAGPSVRELMRKVQVEGAPPDMGRLAAEIVAAQHDAVATAATGADAIVASGVTPAAAAARAVADNLGIRYVYVTNCPVWLASPHHRPLGLPGWPMPPEETDNRVLWERQAQGLNEVFGPALNTHRASIGLPPMDDVGDHVFTDHPWLAADRTLGPWQLPADLEVVQTGAWILPDERPLPADLEAFLDAGKPPVYVGFGSIPVRGSQDLAQDVIKAIRAQGRRVLVSGGWAGLALIDDQDDCLAVADVNHQALFGRVAAVVHHGGAGTTTTAARAGAPQVVVPQIGDQPYWAGRVAELGIGAAHDGPTPTFESLTPALAIALGPETHARAGAVAAMIRTDGAAVAADLLLEAVSRQRPT